MNSAVPRFSLLLFLSVSAAHADIVYLKSGRQIECDQAWEEGKEVKYAIHDGTVGIPKSMVAKIVKSDSSENPTPNPPASNLQTAPSSDGSEPTMSKEEALRLANSYSAMGESQTDKKDYAGALDSFKKAYDLSKTKDTTANLAMAYFQVKDDWNAELYLNELLKIDPHELLALNFLAEIAWSKENLDSAQNYWERYLQIKKDPVIEEKLRRLRKEKKASDVYEDSNSRHFLMKYDGGEADPGLVAEISDYLEDVYQNLSSQFEVYPTEQFVVVLYPQKDYFRITDAPFWSDGINDGKIKLPVGGIRSMSDEMRGVVTHELTHSFIDYKTSSNCPTWLQEGLAQYMEGKRPTASGEDELSKFADQRMLPPIGKIDGTFMEASTAQALVLYLASLSFTQFIIDRYQFLRVNELLENLGKSESLEKAFQESMLVPLSDAEEQWRRELTDR